MIPQSIIFVVAIGTIVAETTTISTPLGQIRGLVHESEQTGKRLKEFRGIPFAKPPIGKLRFRKPVPVEKWSGVLDATSFGAACPQNVPGNFTDFLPKKMSEDCLFLNVYVPDSLEPNVKVPVMVWIHGGGLFMGYSNQYDGSIIATEGNVVVVSMNYRLDILGFLSLNHPAALGNYGLWDQKLALQWVHDNIASFGGDRDSVTIFGESAGGWSVSFQTLIPSNDGLIHRAIAQSGTVNEECLTDKNSKLTNERVINMASKSQCPINDMYKFVDCLRSKEPSEILGNLFDFEKSPDEFELISLPHSPVVDGDLFETNPLEDLKDSNSKVSKFFRSIDFIAGYTSNEHLYMPLMIPKKIQDFYDFNSSESLPAKFMCEGEVRPFIKRFYNGDPKIQEKVCKFYTVENSEDEQSMKAIEFTNDISFVVSANKMLDYHSSGSRKTYQYVFSKEGTIDLMGPPPKYVKGAPHGQELKYLFDMGIWFPSSNQTYKTMSEEDLSLSKTLINYFTSFAKTGVPNGGENSVQWKQYMTKEKNYLDIDTTPMVKQNANSKSVEFWLREMPHSNQEEIRTYAAHDEL